jgi:hypothetical protein
MFVVTEQRHVDYEEDEFFVHDKLHKDKGSAKRAMRKALGNAVRAAVKADYIDDPTDIEFEFNPFECIADGQGWWCKCKIEEVYE